MKTLGIISVVLLVMAGLTLFSLQLYLAKRLTPVLNERVLPAIRESFGVQVSLTHATVNLLKGSAILQGLTIRNPPGYEEPFLLTADQCRLEVDLLSLIKRNPVVIKMAEASGATLTIERNVSRRINLQDLAGVLKAAAEQQPPAQQQPDGAEEPSSRKKAAPVPVHFRRIAVDSRIIWHDSVRQRHEELNLRLTASDLFSVPAEGQPASLMVLRGSDARDKTRFVTDLNAIVEPLTDPRHPSFNATGTLMNPDLAELRKLLKKNEMESSSLALKPVITCRKGTLDGSHFELTLTDLKMYGANIGDTTLKLPLSGTLRSPVLDITGAIQSLFSEQGLKIGKAIGLNALKKQLGMDAAATNRVNEAASPADQPDLPAAATNRPLDAIISDALNKQLGKSVKELEDNDAMKESLRNLGGSLFSK